MLEHLTAKRALDEKTAICFAYYNYRTPELQDPSNIAAALAKQLCCKYEAIPQWLLRYKHDSRSPSTASSPETFVKLASEMNLKEVYIVIDALDECPEQERPRFIALITKIISDLPCAKVFVTSRREGDIERAFTESKMPTIQVQTQSVAADIESFVRSEVKRLRSGYHGKKLFLSSDALEGKVIQTLTEKAEGM